jgi:hypothetical protein
VRFADSITRENLSLPDDPCDLVFDADKLVLEQRQDKQYTFPRSTIRNLSKRASNEIQFELGTRAPVQGIICFRFDLPMDAQACLTQWNADTSIEEIPIAPVRERLSIRQKSEHKDESKHPTEGRAVGGQDSCSSSNSSSTTTIKERKQSSTTSTTTTRRIDKYVID